jgi:hypothetical protein
MELAPERAHQLQLEFEQSRGMGFGFDEATLLPQFSACWVNDRLDRMPRRSMKN